MPFFLAYRTGSHEAKQETEFDTFNDCLDRINSLAAENLLHWFRVIEGKEIKFRPVQRVTEYEIDRG